MLGDIACCGGDGAICWDDDGRFVGGRQEKRRGWFMGGEMVWNVLYYGEGELKSYQNNSYVDNSVMLYLLLL